MTETVHPCLQKTSEATRQAGGITIFMQMNLAHDIVIQMKNTTR